MHRTPSISKHKPNWSPTSNNALLSSIHFEDPNFAVRTSIMTLSGINLKLGPDPISSTETASDSEEVNTLLQTYSIGCPVARCILDTSFK